MSEARKQKQRTYNRAASRAQAILRRRHMGEYRALLSQELRFAKANPDVRFQDGIPARTAVRVPKMPRPKREGTCVDCRGRCHFRAQRCQSCNQRWLRAGRPERDQVEIQRRLAALDAMDVSELAS